ncbi:hypothetical protein KP509_12G013500 [Ceratopteris richardii]|uniref:Rieske domain-containing protein n=2 Tax=Ceratopteris richardii TaxID=49495 RepID=A0A8T2TJ97_CERRI|nr:hypothetical protein KP509_12G013500 [Ceratopteris richardii]
MASRLCSNIDIHRPSLLSGCLPAKRIPTVVLDAFSNGRLRTPARIQATISDGLPDSTEKSSSGWLHVEYPPSSRPPPTSGRLFDVQHAWELVRQDLLYCDWKARRDVLAIKTLHDKAVEVLNPLARDQKSVETLRHELEALQHDLIEAHEQVVHLSEARVAYSLQKLAEMEALVNDKLLQQGTIAESGPKTVDPLPSDGDFAESNARIKHKNRRKGPLNVSGPVKGYSEAIRNFWYPIAFSADVSGETMVPFECFEEPWVIFRGKDGRVGCVQNSCAHRACPLHLGSVNDGCIQCPYHGWEYSTDGVCQKMPSTKFVNVSIRALPCLERDGLIWIWPGGGIPEPTIPSLLPPTGFTVHSEIVLDLPVEHGLLMENLLDLAHAPFTHTSTFARGWPVPSLVKFCTPAATLKGFWDPYPIDMEFHPPCMVLSTIGISKPGKLEGNTTSECSKHLHQLHVCLPSTRGNTRLLYRMSLDFLPILKHMPFIDYLWRYLANKVLDEDLRLVLGQQDRMLRGENVWNQPVAYDKLGLRYRLWRLSIEAGSESASNGR